MSMNIFNKKCKYDDLDMQLVISDCFSFSIYQSKLKHFQGKYGDLDLGGLQLKCNEKTDETLESTRRMMQMCGEAKQVFLLNF